MHRFWIGLAGVCLLLAGCDAQIAPPNDLTPIAAPIATLVPGSHSILVPPTLSPAEQTNAPTAASSDSTDLRLINQSGWKVCYVYIANPNDPTWGSDWLGQDEEIADGSSRVISVPAGVYDMRAESCDYIPLAEEYTIDLGKPYDWTVQGPTLLFEDYFNGSTALAAKGPASVGAVSDNVYRLRAVQKNVFALAAAGQSLNNLAATVETTPMLPADTSQLAYGLMCRLQPNGDGYAFLIRGDGYGAILKIAAGKSTPLVDWTATDQINSGSELNIVEANCDAEKLNLRINGVTVLKTTDSAFTQGDIALVVQPLGESQADVEFDNLVVRQP